MTALQHYDIRCHAHGSSPFTFPVIARTPEQAIAIARIAYPGHLYTFSDRDQPAFIA